MFYHFAETGQDHPGLILITPQHRASSYQLAEWLALLADEPMTNKMVRI